MTDALTAITRLIDAASEEYPRLEGEHGQQITTEAREALRRLAALVVAAIVAQQRRQREALFTTADRARDGWLVQAYADLDLAINDLRSIGPVSEYDSITMHDSPGRHA